VAATSLTLERTNERFCCEAFFQVRMSRAGSDGDWPGFGLAGLGWRGREFEKKECLLCWTVSVNVWERRGGGA